MNLPDLYLDVDGVLLCETSTSTGETNQWLYGMITGNTFRFARIFWLSCWTRTGDASELYLKYPQFKTINAIPLKWERWKTEAIDWTRPFLWIEDGILDMERAEFYTKSRVGQSIWEIRNPICGPVEDNL